MFISAFLHNFKISNINYIYRCHMTVSCIKTYEVPFFKVTTSAGK